VNGGCLPAAMAASWLVNSWDQNAAFQVQSPVATALEETALDWVRELFGLPEAPAAQWSPGPRWQLFRAGRGAPFSAGPRGLGCGSRRPVWRAADHSGGGRRGALVADQGAGQLGLGRNRVVRVPVDGQGRMRADALPHLDGMTILCCRRAT